LIFARFDTGLRKELPDLYVNDPARKRPAFELHVRIGAWRIECGHSMRVIAAITEPTIASRILKCMGLPPRAPPLESAHTSSFAVDPWLEDPADYDQSAPNNWEPGG
jgi:hypothetical protein